MRMFPVMTALDSDGNGEISPEEIKGAVAALKKLDKNKDGKLTEDELRPNFGGRGGASGQRPSRGGEGRGEGRGGQRPSRPSSGE
jgi:formyltetrahydrofolate synthetase